MSKPSILIQLDTDPQPSVFDGVVAVDAGVVENGGPLEAGEWLSLESRL